MSKVYLTFDEMCNMKNQKDWVPEGLQFLSLKQVIIVLFCYLFKFIQIIKNNKVKSYKVKVVSEFFFELQKILKFYIFIYWSQISKKIYIFQVSIGQCSTQAWHPRTIICLVMGLVYRFRSVLEENGFLLIYRGQDFWYPMTKSPDTNNLQLEAAQRNLVIAVWKMTLLTSGWP